MTDGDDRDPEAGKRDVEGEELSGAPAEASPTADDSRSAAPENAGEGAERPAMAMERDSDEGGTVADEDEPAPETQDAADGQDDAVADGEDDDVVFADEDGLGLVSDDDALPWLESSDYEEVDSVDAWRVTGFVVLGLVALALLVGGIWYFASRSDAGAPEADGSVIEAPEGPYKERPEDPGGKTFEGTGDLAPAVGEGESREGRLAEGSATPEPIAPSRAEEEAARAPETEPSAPAVSDNRIAVQVGAYRDKATAEAGWRKLQRQTDALSGVQYRIVKGEADIGTVYRLQALPGNMAAARRLRDALQADGVASQIKQ